MVDVVDHVLPAQAAANTKHAFPELSVVIPAYKERRDAARLAASIDEGLEDPNWEMTFVDDHSPDRADDAIRELALNNPREAYEYEGRMVHSSCRAGKETISQNVPSNVKTTRFEPERTPGKAEPGWR